MASAAVCSKEVVLLVLVQSVVCVGFVFCPCFVMQYFRGNNLRHSMDVANM